ncbi:MAG: MmgE/PrpD family protein, partial [Pseudomonadota bacterium]|nr:MmgE/PrpD family protein [Pseudomonadota bacterium]
STLLAGGTAAAPVAALCNGTLAHCLDFDDTYVKGNTHISAPVWAATLAMGEAAGASEAQMLTAFVTGFETAAQVGRGLGEAVTARGWHATSVFGCLGAAAAAGVLLKLDAARMANALGAAATQAGGLTGSFGTMSKPFHAGKAAMNGVIAAELARSGFVAATGLLDAGGGLDNAIIQDRLVAIAPADFSEWQILSNSFKPFAACHLAHPAIDAAQDAARAGIRPSDIHGVRAEVGALANQVTGGRDGRPSTPLQGKFDLKHCVALALHGHTLSARDFVEPFVVDESVRRVASLVRVEASPTQGYASARLTVQLSNGPAQEFEIRTAKGHPGNAMGWDDMRLKFDGLVDDGDASFQALRTFGIESGAINALRLLAARRAS